MDDSVVLANDTFNVEVSTTVLIGLLHLIPLLMIHLLTLTVLRFLVFLNSSVDYQALVRIDYQSSSIKDVADNSLAVFSLALKLLSRIMFVFL